MEKATSATRVTKKQGNLPQLILQECDNCVCEVKRMATFTLEYNDIVRIYNTAKHDSVDYNLAYIEPDLPKAEHEKFDHSYMNALFDLAYQKNRSGFPWRKAPPILDVARASDHLR